MKRLHYIYDTLSVNHSLVLMLLTLFCHENEGFFDITNPVYVAGNNKLVSAEHLILSADRVLCHGSMSCRTR